jgi:hypothetical protein
MGRNFDLSEVWDTRTSKPPSLGIFVFLGLTLHGLEHYAVIFPKTAETDNNTVRLPRPRYGRVFHEPCLVFYFDTIALDDRPNWQHRRDPVGVRIRMSLERPEVLVFPEQRVFADPASGK